MAALTVLTLIPNAGDRLRPCLESVQWAGARFCVIDPNTTDGSAEIAREYATRAEVRAYTNKADQCNWALPQIETEWTLVLDADEQVTPELRRRIESILTDGGEFDGYYIRRRSYFFGNLIGYCGWQGDYNLRLFRTRKARYQSRRVHATVEVDGPIGRIHEPMLHDDKRDFDEYFRTFQRFTTWAAEDLYERGRRARFTDLTFRPLARFLKMYVIKQGFRDGRHGLVLCGLAAFSVFVKYAKLWDLARRADS